MSLYHHVHSVLSTTTNAMTSLRRHTAFTCSSGNLTRALLRTSPLSSTRTGTRAGTRRYTTASARDGQPGLPQQTDLLDVYRSLMATGRIKYDEDQIRVVMQVRFPHNHLFPLAFRSTKIKLYQCFQLAQEIVEHASGLCSTCVRCAILSIASFGAFRRGSF